MTAPSTTYPIRATALAWLFGLGALVAVRLRAEWPWYVDFHRWLRDQGVADGFRDQDGWVLQLLLAGLGAWLAARTLRTGALRVLWLHVPRPGWYGVVLLASAPMVVGGASLGWWRGGTFADLPLERLLQSSVRAPVLEELLCRGLLVGTVAVAFGVRSAATSLAVVVGALVFGMLHVPWTWDGIAAGWATLLVTGLGGAWYAWLMLRWGSLWPPMLLHATMNLGWLLGQTSGGAGGGGMVDNLLRVATIVVATVGTLRATVR